MSRVSLLGLMVAVLMWSPLTDGTSFEAQQLRFRTEANYIRVDVFPTKDGRPVPDLTLDDFEVVEDGVRQTVDTVERIVIRSGVTQNVRRDPNTLAESRDAAGGGRDRLFVLFLDFNHVDIDGSQRIRQPLVSALDRLLGADDLVAVMTPEMRARDITFARKTTTIDAMLQRYWTWGERNRLNPVDPIDDYYKICYPGAGPLQIPAKQPPRGAPRPYPSQTACLADDRGIADEMIERRHEKQTLDALHDLVGFLATTSDSRKAVLTITEGWRLFEPSQSLGRELYCQVPQASDLGVDPKTGRITTRGTDPQQTFAVNADCERDRKMLANIDDKLEFLDILQRANRANVSFYPVDPRGLAVFDTSLDQLITGRPVNSNRPSPSQDAARLTARLDSLHSMAVDTDGLAIVNTTDVDAGLQRMVDDLSSYYLLGYYSTGRLDGKFHSISVRVKRPGVDVRARRGFLAASLEELNTAAAVPAADAAAEADAARAAARIAALAPLATIARPSPLRIAVASALTTAGAASIWFVAETANRSDWAAGGSLQALLVNGAGESVAGTSQSLAPGTSSVRVSIALPASLPPGPYELQVRLRPSGDGTPESAAVPVLLADTPRGAIWLRRGPTTGNRDVPTADLRFRRTDTLTLELPVAAGANQFTARLVDRAGMALDVPTTVATRPDSDGVQWLSVRLSLAPLAAGDYLIEVTGGSDVTLTGFRIVP